MKSFVRALLLVVALQLHAGDKNWPPAKVEIAGRTTEVFRHGPRKEWGYRKYQDDTFIVVHPKIDREQAPLYVVLHSAGHSVWSAVKCTAQVGNHDIYRSPDDFYALYLDCRANKGDWWWGGMHPRVADSMEKNSGGELGPTEKRVIGTVKWVIETYEIDPNRVYLCGNSMGGSGTLGIGVRHGELFAAIKANVPAGVEHVCDRMYLPPKGVPDGVTLPDPPVVIDYSGQNDHWSKGHERFAQGMNGRKYPLYLYWGPFGHANNHARIMRVNDLINSLDWLNIRKDEAYAVFTNASCNDALPWPDHLDNEGAGQVNAFFRWKTLADTADKLELSLYLVSSKDVKTRFTIPSGATADVSVRRIQAMQVKPGQAVSWSFGDLTGSVTADAEGVITVPDLRITSVPAALTILR
ncbi:MAG: hypothetical protein HN742_01455 [Lentisphaerae bacterium]|jgi:poly(3-hydroxybutyrate) depolymerase|nr:hypothetical protein [Lentisphaerota bacterium]MBT4818450.1 hypothetical protein [Lentisphaerota bacterium]MBT5612463.1 hypothetical protein [Lentisphaerota bacterium]MBT7055400.1 hypothetical protein [Lentisphaerota bacterium]MBT7840501.1 hypothetical protein [Lentisphaerota bacterium]